MNEPAPVLGFTNWREHAVSRSIDPARVRAEKRVQRFLDAALELMSDSDTGKDFTVQQVVERSRQSLRSFYQYFGGKHELLLTLFEESVRSTAEYLRERVDQEDEAFDRLHCLVVEYYRLCRPERKRKKTKTQPRAMADFPQELLTAHPTEAAQAFVPVVSLFEEVIGEAVDAGVVRADRRGPRVIGVVLEAIMFNLFSSTIGGSPAESDAGDPAEELWDLILHGIGSF